MTTSTDGSARPPSRDGPTLGRPPGPAAGGPEPAAGLIDGRYRLGELLGVGGTASVFAAEDLGVPAMEPGVAVALKIAHPHLSADDGARETFLDRARAVASLRHPNLVAVRDLGVHDAGGEPLAWIATDLVVGPSLAQRVADGPLPVAEAASLAEGVLGALAAVHAAGLVHRDVAPGNVLLEPGPTGRARLTDFGLVDAPGRLTTLDPGSVAGSVHFMSPEQAQGRPVDARGDLYQVGALLYLALTGQPPFPRPTVEQVLAAHVQAPPPVPSAVAAGVPLALDRVVARAMAKDPGRRFGSAAAMAEALRRAVPPRPDDTAPRGVPAGPVPARADGDGAGERPLARTAEVPVLGAPVPGPARETDRALAGASAPEVPARSGVGATATLVALLAGVLLWAWAPWGVDEPGDDTAAPVVITRPPTPSETPAAPVESDPGPVPEPAPVVVPELAGLLDDVRLALEAAGLAVGQVTEVAGAAPAGTVLSAAPPPGSAVAPGSLVDLAVASGFNAVPAVADLADAEAQAAVEAAGFVAARLFVTDPSVPPGAVTGTRPATGAVRAVGSTVWLLVSQAGPPSPDPAPDPTEEPDPTGTPDPTPTDDPDPDPTGTPTEPPTEPPTETPTETPTGTPEPAVPGRTGWGPPTASPSRADDVGPPVPTAGTGSGGRSRGGADPRPAGERVAAGRAISTQVDRVLTPA